MPQSKLQRISEIEKFKEKLARLESEAKLTRKFIDDPSLFSKVYQEEVGEGNFSQKLQATLDDMNETQNILAEMIAYYEDEQFQILKSKRQKKN